MFDNLSPEAKTALAALFVAACFVLRDVIIAWGKRQISKANTQVSRAELDVKLEEIKLQAVQRSLDSERHLRTLIDELNTDLGVKDERIAHLTRDNEKLTTQQNINIQSLSTLQTQFDTYRKDRHQHDTELATKLADSELRALNAERSLADCIDRSNKLIVLLGDKTPDEFLSTGIADQQ